MNQNEDRYETEFMNKINVPFFRTNKSIIEPQMNLMELFSSIWHSIHNAIFSKVGMSWINNFVQLNNEQCWISKSEHFS